jgi:hypothetical protein
MLHNARVAPTVAVERSRDLGVDVARGVAVFSMFVAHFAPSAGPGGVLILSEYLTAPCSPYSAAGRPVRRAEGSHGRQFKICPSSYAPPPPRATLRLPSPRRPHLRKPRWGKALP